MSQNFSFNPAQFKSDTRDPEINFRELTETVWSCEGGKWKASTMFEHRKEWDMPVMGKSTACYWKGRCALPRAWKWRLAK